MRILPVVLFLSLTTPAFAGDTASRQVMEDLYARLQKARDTNDVKTVKEMVSPHFMGINVTGETMNYDQLLDLTAKGRKDPSKTGKTTLTTITQDGKVATVIHHYEETQSKALPGGNALTAKVVTDNTDTWVNENDKWLLQKTIATDVDYFVNGKEMMHKKWDNGVKGATQ